MRRFLRIFFGLLAVLLLLGNSQCQNSSSSGQNPDRGGSAMPALVTTLAVQDANGNATSTFAMGAPIQFQLSVFNRSNSVQTVALAICGTDENYVVLDAGASTPLWDAMAHEVQCAHVPVGSMILQPGETQSFTALWNQTDDQGQAVAAGSYEVMGGITCDANTAPDGSGCMASLDLSGAQLTPSPYRSTLVEFTIH